MNNNKYNKSKVNNKDNNLYLFDLLKSKNTTGDDNTNNTLISSSNNSIDMSAGNIVNDLDLKLNECPLCKANNEKQELVRVVSRTQKLKDSTVDIEVLFCEKHNVSLPIFSN